MRGRLAERRYRDPVHNIISLDSSKLADALLINLIDSAEFQRLRRIKQLGLALYTYQGAEHSRFTHSLGVMHIMTRVLSHLEIPEEVHMAARVAALLHDLGHGPFSHVIEKATCIKHEHWTEQILLDPETEVHQILVDVDPHLPQTIASIYRHEYMPSYVCQMVSSQLDCDRFDYLLRDSLMTGAKYGNYDLEWIIHALRLDLERQQIYVSAKGLYAVEEYLQARFYMFRQVYFHHSLRAVENMLISILRRAVRLMEDGLLGFVGSAVTKLLGRQEMTTAEFLSLDDHDLMFHIKQWTHEEDSILKDLCYRFINRRLFKSIDLRQEHNEAFLEEARSIVEAAGYDPQYYLLRDNAADIPYFGPYEPEAAKPRARIYVEARHLGSPSSHELHEITEVSEVVRGMRGFSIERLCFPKEVSQQMYTLLRDWRPAQ